jgi:nucleotidyltransferase substrate binding protein (TIGR01987 family)
MKKFDNFSNSLDVLKGADFEFANNNVIYRTGVIGQFNLTFELAWKALQEVLRLHGAIGAETGSPREILQLGYKFGFIDDSAVWLLMLKKRNLSIHIYDEEEIDEMILLTRDSFIPAFSKLEETLREKIKYAQDSEVK